MPLWLMIYQNSSVCVARMLVHLSEQKSCCLLVNCTVNMATPVAGGWAGAVMIWAGAAMPWAGAVMI